MMKKKMKFAVVVENFVSFVVDFDVGFDYFDYCCWKKEQQQQEWKWCYYYYC